MQIRSGYVMASLLVLVALIGCDTGPATIALKGKVSQDSQPVTGGNLIFAPIATDGKVATSPVVTTIQSDGAFNVPVVAGKYTVTYEAPQIAYDAPEWDGKGAPPVSPQSPYAGLVVKDKEVEAAAGSELTIELVKPGA